MNSLDKLPAITQYRYNIKYLYSTSGNVQLN